MSYMSETVSPSVLTALWLICYFM